MKQILTDLKFKVLWDEENKIVYVRDSIKVNQLNQLRKVLFDNGFYYKNLIIGKNYDGE